MRLSTKPRHRTNRALPLQQVSFMNDSNPPSFAARPAQPARSKGKLTGPKPPLRPGHVWSIKRSCSLSGVHATRSCSVPVDRSEDGRVFGSWPCFDQRPPFLGEAGSSPARGRTSAQCPPAGSRRARTDGRDLEGQLRMVGGIDWKLAHVPMDLRERECLESPVLGRDCVGVARPGNTDPRIRRRSASWRQALRPYRGVLPRWTRRRRFRARP